MEMLCLGYFDTIITVIILLPTFLGLRDSDDD